MYVEHHNDEVELMELKIDPERDPLKSNRTVVLNPLHNEYKGSKKISSAFCSGTHIQQQLFLSLR